MLRLAWEWEVGGGGPFFRAKAEVRGGLGCGDEPGEVVGRWASSDHGAGFLGAWGVDNSVGCEGGLGAGQSHLKNLKGKGVRCVK